MEEQRKIALIKNIVALFLVSPIVFLFLSFSAVILGWCFMLFKIYAIAAFNSLNQSGHIGTVLFLLVFIIGFISMLFIFILYLGEIGPILLKNILSITKNLVCKEYCIQFKQQVISQIISTFSQDFTYSPEQHISADQFFESKLLYEDEWNEVQGDDLVQVNHQGIQITFSELSIISDFELNEEQSQRYILWHGFFFVVDCPKKFRSGLGTSMSNGKEKILLDNPEFNELFPIWTEDSLEAFYILPSSLLDRLAKFAHKTGRKFDFSVVGDKFYIAIPYNRELLEPPIFKSLFDYSIYEEYLEDLELAIGIVEDLNLQTK